MAIEPPPQNSNAKVISKPPLFDIKNLVEYSYHPHMSEGHRKSYVTVKKWVAESLEAENAG